MANTPRGEFVSHIGFLEFYTKLFPSQEVLEIESNLKSVEWLGLCICIVHSYISAMGRPRTGRQGHCLHTET